MMSAGAVAPTSTYLKWGFLGGFIGAVLMVVFMSIAGASLGMPQALLLRALGVSVLGLAPADFTATMMGGLILHLINGTFIISAILVGVVLAVKRGILINGTRRGLWVGLLAGVVVYIVFGLPMLLGVMAPGAVKAVAFTMPLPSGMTPQQVIPKVMEMLSMKIGFVAVAFFFAHLIYGASLGTVVGYGVSRKTIAPAVAKAAPTQQFKCQACGMAFGSQSELMEHAKKAHPMPPG